MIKIKLNTKKYKVNGKCYHYAFIILLSFVLLTNTFDWEASQLVKITDVVLMYLFIESSFKFLLILLKKKKSSKGTKKGQMWEKESLSPEEYLKEAELTEGQIDTIFSNGVDKIDNKQ